MQARDHRPRLNKGGFTLLELIVALTILALIAGSVTAGLRLASASIERGETVARDAARLRAAIGILERAIRSADLLPAAVGDNTTFFFVGERNSLRFITAQPPAAISGGGPRLISFHELPGPEGGVAVSTASPFRAEGVERWGGTESPRVLFPGSGELSFSYSSGPDEKGEWEWLHEWNPAETGRLPAAIRVEFVVRADDGNRKTAIVVPVPASGELDG
jgi:general secretion pathway protein J